MWGFKRGTLIAALAGLIIGGGAIIGLQQANKMTSTDAFCTNCHSMAYVAADPAYPRSVHRAGPSGIRASCGDCHIPRDNLLRETYTHVTRSIKDIYMEVRFNFSDPAVWAARRPGLTEEVLARMRDEDSVTCRYCHDAAAIRPRSAPGRAAHAVVPAPGMTCIDCHVNLVHQPAAPVAKPPAGAQPAASKFTPKSSGVLGPHT
jgi:nitrate/TMAO reductase-like tetraheme cytochrome c subunit